MNRPATIDGSAVIASTIVRTNCAKRPPTSFRNSAVTMPSGIEMASAMLIWISVPTIACATPPTSSPSSGPANSMSWMKKFRCVSASQPRLIVKITTNSSAAIRMTPALASTHRHHAVEHLTTVRGEC